MQRQQCKCCQERCPVVGRGGRASSELDAQMVPRYAIWHSR